MKVLLVSVSALSLMSTSSVWSRPSNYSYRVSDAAAPLRVEFALYAKPPTYPVDAQAHHIEGVGRFEIQIRRDGTVESVRALKSTGHRVLDAAAMAALRDWRFRSGAPKFVRVPIAYTAESADQFVRENPFALKSFGDGARLIVSAAKRS